MKTIPSVFTGGKGSSSVYGFPDDSHLRDILIQRTEENFNGYQFEQTNKTAPVKVKNSYTAPTESKIKNLIDKDVKEQIEYPVKYEGFRPMWNAF